MGWMAVACPAQLRPELTRSASLVPRLLRVRNPSGKLDEIEMEDREHLNQIPVEETLNGQPSG